MTASGLKILHTPWPRCLVRVTDLTSVLLFTPGSCVLLPLGWSAGLGPPPSWDPQPLVGPLPCLALAPGVQVVFITQ